MDKKTIEDIEVEGKRVLVRVDLNVPLDKKTGAITDDTRIQAVLPTIRYLIDNRARVILCSHLGRPKGKVVEGLRLAPVARRLSELLEQPVASARDSIGPEVEMAVKELKEGEVLLLENIRFHPEEEKNDPDFAHELAQLADVFVNDAFGTTHRSHASIVGVTAYLPAVAGFLIQKELEVMGKALNNPARPLAALIGGAKVSDKMELLENILNKVDALLIGGSMAATFLKAQNCEVGKSPVEEDKLGFAHGLARRAKENGVNLLLPVDAVVAENIDEKAPSRILPLSDIPTNWYIADIGPKTIELFSRELKRCKTIIWNGPMGVFEIPQFAQGTQAMATLLSEVRSTAIIGGGSTAEAVKEMGLADKMSHVSTGGGASLRFLEGRTLPGVESLEDKDA